MVRDWDVLFETWRKPPSETEQQKAEAVRSAITHAVIGNPRFASLHPKFVLHGSYGNNTNVRLESDVDVAVVVTDYCIADFTLVPGMTRTEAGISDATYTLSQARQDVEVALRDSFGWNRVQAKPKAIHISESTRHIEADVIACVEYWLYYGRSREQRHSGICFQSQSGQLIKSWPEQNKANSTAKAQRTSRRYKKVVRILKRLRNEMADKGHGSASKMCGFLIESLAYNVPDHHFGQATLRKDIRQVIAAGRKRVSLKRGRSLWDGCFGSAETRPGPRCYERAGRLFGPR